MFVNFVVSVPTLISKQPVPSPPRLSTPSLIIVINCTSISLNLSWIVFNLFRIVLPVPWLKLLIFSHTTPILKPLHWLKINERINYKLLSLTYKVLTTTEPSYLYKLISVGSAPRNTRSSSSVTISRPSSSSLKISNGLFRFASPHLWNQLPVSFRQSTNQSPSHSLHFTRDSSGISSSFLTSLAPSLSYSPLKIYLFHKSFPS